MNGELYDEEAQRAVEAICEENKELKARVDNLRGCLIAVICGYSKRKISPKELSVRSDEALCAQVVILSSLQALLAEVEYE